MPTRLVYMSGTRRCWLARLRRTGGLRTACRLRGWTRCGWRRRVRGAALRLRCRVSCLLPCRGRSYCWILWLIRRVSGHGRGTGLSRVTRTVRRVSCCVNRRCGSGICGGVIGPVRGCRSGRSCSVTRTGGIMSRPPKIAWSLKRVCFLPGPLCRMYKKTLGCRECLELPGPSAPYHIIREG